MIADDQDPDKLPEIITVWQAAKFLGTSRMWILRFLKKQAALDPDLGEELFVLKPAGEAERKHLIRRDPFLYIVKGRARRTRDESSVERHGEKLDTIERDVKDILRRLQRVEGMMLAPGGKGH